METPKVNYLLNSLCNDKGMAFRGTKLFIRDLDDMLELCSKLKRNTSKHKDGSIFAYTSQGEIGMPDDKTDMHNSGVLFLDLDYLPKDITDLLYDNFESLCKKIPFLYAVQYSSSYYLKPNEKTGLHIYGLSSELDYDEYNRMVGIAYAWIAHVVKADFGIDLASCGVRDHEKDVLDTTAKLTQRLFLYYSPYKKNQFALPVHPDGIDKATVDELKKEYARFIHSSKVVDYTVDPSEYSVTETQFKRIRYEYKDHWKMINVLHKCGYKDADILRIMLDTYDDTPDSSGKNWSGRHQGKSLVGHFIQMINSSHAQKVTGTVFKKGVALLSSVGVNVASSDIQIPDGQRIYNFRKEITQFIDNHDRTLIVAGTGTGKTTLINGSSEWNVESFASELNAVVVVPYLANNKLYSSMTEVSSLNGNDVPPNQPCVMVIDQAVKHWREISERNIIVDEVHQLFLDRSFRERAAALMTLLKTHRKKLVCFTATPTGEVESLGLSKLEFSNNRNEVKIHLQDTDAIDISELNYIKKAVKENWADRIVLFDSHSAKKIYEWFLVDTDLAGDIAYLRSETKGTEVFNEVCDTQTLTKKLTICTPVAFNGLNFNNENERILVVGSIRGNDTTPAEIIQYIGRVRNSKVTAKLFYDSEEASERKTVEELRDKALAYDEIIRRLDITPNPFVGLYDPSLLEKEFADAKISVDQYRRNYPTFKEVMEGLAKYNYITVTMGDERWMIAKDKKHGVPQLRLKKKMAENEEFIGLMEQGDVLEYEFTTDYVINYKDQWQRQLKEILEYEGITMDGLLKIVQSKKKGVLVETVFNNIKEICRITSITESEWEKYIRNVDQVKSLINQQYVKEFLQHHKKNLNIRKNYAGKIYMKDDTIRFDDLFSELLKETETMKVESRKKMGEIHLKPIQFKTSAYLPTKLKPYGGKKFKSCSEAAITIGCSDDTITNYLKRGYCFECQ